jgi:hypothetical protein
MDDQAGARPPASPAGGWTAAFAAVRTEAAARVED